jgi:hypothetical protein
MGRADTVRGTRTRGAQMRGRHTTGNNRDDD